MNVHHLELFYYVAKHGGISEAVRKIPYGIQQPAVSGQIIQLEEFLGVTLFQRRPFHLTAAGEELFAFIEPFFGNIGAVTTRLQGGTAHQIRIGASEIVLRDHLPELVQVIHKNFPQLKISLRESHQPQLESWLEAGEIDLAVTLLNAKSPQGIHTKPLVSLPLVLLVPQESKLKSAKDLWKRDKIEEPLIALPPNEIVCKTFQEHLGRIGVDWFPSVEVSSLNLVEVYVAKGYGIGLSLQIPRVKPAAGVRVLALPEFPAVMLGVLWRGKAAPLTQMFLDELVKRAGALGTGF